MKKQDLGSSKLIDGISAGPEHASWTRITTANNMIGLFIFIALAVAFIFVINLHLRPNELAAVLVCGVMVIAVLMLWLAWKVTPQRRRGRK
jgi:uncharacterized membrane protein